MCVEPYCAVERGAWVHAVAGVGARTPVRARVQLTLCRSLPVVRATARPRHTDSDRVVRREVLERSHNESRGKISACWPAACRVRGGGHTVCMRRAVWHACAPLALDAYDTSGGSPSHALTGVAVRHTYTLTPDHRHLSGTSHPTRHVLVAARPPCRDPGGSSISPWRRRAWRAWRPRATQLASALCTLDRSSGLALAVAAGSRE